METTVEIHLLIICRNKTIDKRIQRHKSKKIIIRNVFLCITSRKLSNKKKKKKKREDHRKNMEVRLEKIKTLLSSSPTSSKMLLGWFLHVSLAKLL